MTSRNEDYIQRVLTTRFKAYNLLVDEKKNRQDIRTFLRFLASPHFKGFDVKSLVHEIFEKFKIKVQEESLEALNVNIQGSIDAYGDVIAVIEQQNPEGMQLLLQPRDLRPAESELLQPFKSLEDGMSKAAKARSILLDEIASAWEVYETVNGTMRKPVPGKEAAWIKEIGCGLSAVDPDLKSTESALRKMNTEYKGEVNKLKDLVRISFTANDPGALVKAIEHMQKLPGWDIVSLKNKYASPTPLGYRDINSVFRIPIADGEWVLCEMQFHLLSMIEVKNHAHEYYENIRVALPALCKGTKVNPDDLQAYVKQRLDSSALDAAVEKMEEKAGGLFIYAKLLGEHIHAKSTERQRRGEETKLSFEDITELPNGLHDLYRENFLRAFPEGTQSLAWKRCKDVIALIVAAKEPLPVALARCILKWNNDVEASIVSELSLLFPIRDGSFHVLHKTVVDWLLDTTRNDKTYHISAKNKVDAQKRLAHTCLKLAEEKVDDDKYKDYPLRFAIQHACDVGNQQDLRNRAITLVADYMYLYIRSSLSPTQLLRDVQILEGVMKNSEVTASDNTLSHSASLLRSALQLSMQGLLFNFR